MPYYNSPIQGMVRLPNTDGTSFIQSAWQSSSPTGVASNTTMWFDSTGRMNWNPGVIGTTYTRTFDATGITANRTWTLPDGTTTIAGLAIAQTFTAAQTYSVNGALSAPGQLATGLWQGAATVTAASADATTATFTCKNTFIVGQTVTITGLTSTSGTNLNLTSVTIATASSTQFTVTGSYTNPSTTSGTGSANVTANTATTTKPYWLIEPSGTTSTGWSTSGTGIGVNAASGFSGNLIDLQVAGSTYFKVNSSGINNGNNSVSNIYSLTIGSTSAISLFSIRSTSASFSNVFSTTGFGISQAACTYTSTGSSGTIALTGINTFAQPTLQPPSNTNITLTDVATMYIADAPAFTTNGSGTITNSHSFALLVNNGQACFKGGVSTGLASSSSNAYLTADASINSTSNAHAQLVSGASNTAFRILLGGSSTSSGSTASGYYYANTIVTASPINLATSGTTVPFATSLGIRPIGSINQGTVTNSASLYIDGASTVATNNYALYVNSGTSYFGGAISIGNTVNSVSPTSPNRTITMVIGGTTYYISAKTTND